MSIIKCPECGTQVSTLAQQCPGCGVQICNNIEECAACGTLYIKSQGQCPYCGEEPDEIDEIDEEEVDDMAEIPATPAPKPQGRRFLSCLVSLLLLAALGGGGYVGYGLYQEHLARQEEDQRFSDLAPLTNPDFYRQFLTDYPLSAHRAEVEARLQALLGQDKAWADALRAGTRQALTQFLATYPQAVQTPKCIQLIDSADWAAAQLSSVPGAIQAYLEAHPEGIYTAQAVELLQKISRQRTTDQEQEAIASLLQQLFSALAQRDADQIEAIVTEPLHSVQGKPRATVADILAFAKGRYSKGVTALSYQIEEPLGIVRDKLPNSTTGFRATCTVVETRTAAKNLPLTRFSADILFDAAYNIVGIELNK